MDTEIKNRLYDLLSNLKPTALFDEVVFKYEIPSKFISIGKSQAEKAIEVIQYVESRNELTKLQEIIERVTNVSPSKLADVSEAPARKNRRKNQVSKDSNYEYQVFISYSRSQKNWVHSIFIPCFKHCLEEELLDAGIKIEDKNKIIFFDEQIESGDEWPIRLFHALTRSCVLVPLWSASYFNSVWCMTELNLMYQREKENGFRTNANPAGLIVPLLIWDGQSIPEPVRSIQWHDIKDYVNAYMARNSEKAEKFFDTIKIWTPHVVEAIKKAPQYNEQWLERNNRDIQKFFRGHNTAISQSLPSLAK